MRSEIKTILDGLKIGEKSIPVAHIRYLGSEKTFVTWQIISETPSLKADDVYQCSTVTVDIDVFSDGNYEDIVDAIKDIMTDNDWIWSGDSSEMFEEETKLYHQTLTFEKEKE